MQPLPKHHEVIDITKSFICSWKFVSLAFAVLLFTRLAFVWQTPPLALDTFGSPEENLLVLVGAKNMLQNGWLSTVMLPDYVTSENKEHHPVVYTHFPPMPTIAAAIMLDMGMEYKEIRLVYVILNVVGWLIGGLVFQKVMNLPTKNYLGIYFFIISFTIPALIWCDHFEYGVMPLLAFAPILLLYTEINQGIKNIAIWVLLFVGSIWNYKILFMSGLIFFISYFFANHTNKSLKNLIIYLSAPAAGISLHILQNIIFLGPAIAFHELYLTLQNRITGVPSNTSLKIWFEQNNLVCWGTSEKLTIQNYIKIIWLFLDENTKIFKKIFPIHLWLVLAFLLFSYSDLKGQHNKLKVFGGAVTVGSILWSLLFPAHSKGYFLPLTDTLPAIFAGYLAWVIFLEFLFATKKKSITNKYRFLIINVIFLAGLISIGHFAHRFKKLTIEYATIINKEVKLNYYAEAQVLKKYGDKVLWTNMTSVWVSYFSNSIVPGRCDLNGLKQRTISSCGNFFINSKACSKWLEKPDYFVFSKTKLSGNVAAHSQQNLGEMESFLQQNLELVYEGKAFKIFAFHKLD